MASDSSEQLMDLKVVSPSTSVPHDLHFPSLPTSTTVQQLKEKIRDAVASHPPVDRQRLIYQGRPRANPSETMVDVFGAQALQQSRQHTIHLVVRDWASAPTTSAPPQRTASVPPDTFHLPAPPVFSPFQNPTGVPRPSSQPTFHPPVNPEHFRQHLQAHQRALQQAEQAHQAHLTQHASLHTRPVLPQQHPLLPDLPLPQGLLPPALNMAAMQDQLAAVQLLPDLSRITTEIERSILEQARALEAQHGSPGIAPLPGPDERRQAGYPTLEQMRAIVLRWHQLARQGMGQNNSEFVAVGALMRDVDLRIRDAAREALMRRRRMLAQAGNPTEIPALPSSANVATSPSNPRAADQHAFQRLVAMNQQERALARMQGVQIAPTEATPDASGQTTLNDRHDTLAATDGANRPSLPTVRGNPSIRDADTPGNLSATSTSEGQPSAQSSIQLLRQSFEDLIEQVIDQHFTQPNGQNITSQQTMMPSGQRWTVTINNSMTIPHVGIGLPPLPGQSIPQMPQIRAPNHHMPLAQNNTPATSGSTQGALGQIQPADISRIVGRLDDLRRQIARLEGSVNEADQQIFSSAGIAGAVPQAERQAIYQQYLRTRTRDLHTSLNDMYSDMMLLAARLGIRADQGAAGRADDRLQLRAHHGHEPTQTLLPGGVATDATTTEPAVAGQMRADLLREPDEHTPAPATSSQPPECYLLSSPNGPEALLIGPHGQAYTTDGLPRHTHDALFNPQYNNPAADFGRLYRDRLQADLDNMAALFAATPYDYPAEAHQPPPAAPVPPQQQQIRQLLQERQRLQNLLAHLRPHLARLNLAAHAWLLFRIALFIYVFAGSSGWRHPVVLGAAGAVVYLAQIGALGDLPERVRRHFEGVLGGVQGGAQGHGQAGGREGGQRGPPMEPRDVAQRLVRERREREAGWVRRQLRTVERAMALFVASLWPGVGERVVRAQEELVRERERVLLEQQQGQQGQAGQESAVAAGENAVEAEAMPPAQESTGNQPRQSDTLRPGSGSEDAAAAAAAAKPKRNVGPASTEAEAQAQQTGFETERAGQGQNVERRKGKEKAPETAEEGVAGGSGEEAQTERRTLEERAMGEWGSVPDVSSDVD